MDTAIQKLKDQFKRRKSISVIPASLCIRGYQHERANGRSIERFADAYRMADDDVPLKLLDLVSADYLVLECTEAGRYSVGDLAAVEKRIDGRRRSFNISFRMLRERDSRYPRFAVGYGGYLLEGQIFAVQRNVVHRHRF
jgi:hypothetical protein